MSIHFNLSFQQLESQFSIFDYGCEMYTFLLTSIIRLTDKGLFEKLKYGSPADKKI